MGPSFLVLSVVAACGPSPRKATDQVTRASEGADHVEMAPAPSSRLSLGQHDSVAATIDTYFEGQGTRRMHVQLDRPLYKPGDTVWIKSWSVATRGLAAGSGREAIYELLDPSGRVVETRRVVQEQGTATNDIVLDPAASGGKWTLRATSATGEVDERPFIVSSYETPRIRKELEFVREAYGPGDRVEALVELERGTGGPLAGAEVRALLQLGGRSVSETVLTTDETGAVLVAAPLPADLDTSDGLLTVLVEDGGVTESISRSVPIVLADAQLAFFPEGGDLVAGLPGRVYFAATNQHGEPADVRGVVEDARGREIATFESVHDGLGRFSYTPDAGAQYVARITSPAGIDTQVALPTAVSHEGACTLRAFDDPRSAESEVRVAVRCRSEQAVVVTGVLRETVLDVARVRAGPRSDAVVYLDPGDHADQQGAVRVTVFDENLAPLAERLIYRNHGQNLQIEVTPDRGQYGPRDPVVLAVSTRDPAGEPVAAELALAVVDDAVIGLADDENGHMLTRLYLEPELVDSPKDPAFYFDPDEGLAARAMDLVMGTKGHRRFEWRAIWAAPTQVAATKSAAGPMRARRNREERVELPQAAVPAMAPMPMEEAELDVPVVLNEAVVEGLVGAAAPAMEEPMRQAKAEAADVMHGARARDEKKKRAARRPMAKEALADRLAADDMDFAGGLVRQDVAWAPVRVFPVPDYRAGFTGVRSDFRDTVFWAPKVRTGADGTASVEFYLSDAVTSFRVTTEGLAAGHAGHHETTLSSVLPVSIATRLPPAVSAGDWLDVPITVTNTRAAPLEVSVLGAFDAPMVTSTGPSGTLTVPAGDSDTYWVPLEIGAGSASVPVRLTATGGGLSDVVERTLEVVPTGFPRGWTGSGEAEKQTFRFELDETVPGSLAASVTWHPSPVSNLIEGMEGLISTPGGCFEQTSSTNWPNVAILNYLEAHEGDPRLKVRSHQALKAGYDKLTGYQVDAGGFETWGSGPGKEVLSAFGLLQFRDMKQVFPVANDILERDADYLRSVRTGKGGYDNSGSSAHGYGSAPPEVLDGFITYALVDSGYGDDLEAEIAQQAQVARTTDDPYVLALAVRSLIGASHAGAADAAARLARLQADDGSFPGATSSITRSHEANLLVESTALSALALMRAGGHRAATDAAAQWLIDNRVGSTWGATQATALALGALTEHADQSRVPRTGGVVSLRVNGRSVGTLSYDAEHADALLIDGWARALRPGANTVVVEQLEGTPLPFAIDVAWKSESPTSDEGAELSLDTVLGASKVTLGKTVRLTATVRNRAGRVVPSPIARIGLPAGLEAQTWQLEQLQERGEIAFFETRPREVTLYWDGIHADETHEVALDLTAVVPGRFTAPASSAYPYYNDDEKAWSAGATVIVDR